MRYHLLFILLNCFLPFASAQLYLFENTVPVTASDSTLTDAFAAGQVKMWKVALGHPFLKISAGQTLAVLRDKEGITLERTFEHCNYHHLQVQLQVQQAAPAELVLSWKNTAGEMFNWKCALGASAASGQTMLYLHQLLLPRDYSNLTLSFVGTGNTLFIRQLEIITECLPVLHLQPGTGRVTSADRVEFDPMTILPGDSLVVYANNIHISGEVKFEAGAEVHFRSAPCATTKDSCLTLIPEKPEPVSFVIYNFLSPNGDGLNDVFYIEGLQEYPDAELLILTKAGKKVFHAKPYHNDWDGGTESRGIYHYQLRLQNGQKPLSGEVVLEK